MLVAAVGVVAAAALLAIAPIYTEAMSDLGLRFRLDRDLADPERRTAWIEVDRLMIGDPVDRAKRDAVGEVTEARIGWLTDEVLVEERSSRLELSFVGHEDAAPDEPFEVTERTDDPPRQPWGAFLFYLAGFEDQVEVVEGRLPGPAAQGAEVVLPDGFQRHAALGDEIRVTGRAYDDCPNIPPSEDPETAQHEVRCVPTAFVSTSATATIVGFVRPLDPGDTRWTLFQGEWDVPDVPFLPSLAGISGEDPRRPRALGGEGSMPLLTTHEQLFGPFAERLPELQSRHRIGFVMDTDALRLPDVPFAIGALDTWRTDINQGLGLLAPWRLAPLDALERFRNLQTFSQVPLLLILLQVVGIVLYYVAVVMAMLLDRQQEEMAVYRSRGATTTQLVGFHLVEGLTLAVPAFLVGPWIAAGVVALLGLTPVFTPATGGALLPVSVTAEAYLLGAGGALITLLAILLPAFVVARRGIVDVKRQESRPSEQNLLQRFYLDFGVVAVAGILLWQLRQRGSVFDPDAVGGWSSDPLLLLSPLVVTLAVALMVLRFYPPLLRIAVSLLLVLRSTAVAIGLRRAGRAPAAYARLVLLLIMAISVGTFAASYGPTVDQSLEERARYNAGVALRAPLAAARAPSDEVVDEVRDHPAVSEVALAYRGTLGTLRGRQVPLLAIEPERAADMLWSREDFVDRPFADAVRMAGGRPAAPGGIELPEDAVAFETAFYSNHPTRALVRARFRTADGDYFTVSFQRDEEGPPPDEWHVLSAELPTHREAPFSFVSFLVTDRLGQNLRMEGSLLIDELTAVRADGSREVIEDFEGPFTWTMYEARQLDETFEITTANAYAGDQAAEWTWATTISPNRRVLAPIDPVIPLAVVGDAAGLGGIGVSVGRVGDVLLGDVRVPVNVREAVNFFPTLSPGSGYVVVNHEHLRMIVGAVDDDGVQAPNELWIDFAPGATLGEQREVLDWLASIDSPLRIVGDAAVHRDALLDETRANPTLRASGSGILVVAFASVLGLSMLGFVVTLVLGARARVLEFAVLRAVGASPREILRALLLEWGTVLVVGLAIGLALGRQVARIMLSFLEVTEDGTRVLPPFILMTDWLTLGIGGALLVGIVLAALGLAWAAAMRQADATQLRMTR